MRLRRHCPGPDRRPSAFRGTGLTRRLTRLYLGLVLYGASAALQLRAGLGLGPWDVFHQGVARHTGLSIGTVSIAVGAVVLLLWIPLRERPGLGTASNVVVVGLSLDATLLLAPEPRAAVLRAALLGFAVALNGLATGLYISARFGAGPRDGLMTRLHEITGRSVRLIRTSIEVTVLACGCLLGGSAGVGTVVYALAIGPLAQVFLRIFGFTSRPGRPRRRRQEGKPGSYARAILRR
ncbi:membrane protein YczE [Streptomyces meridianus]|uniref:Integral membrane protein n=1 Tax=Streptomyces meridianus TaxID=2938945 RepID=A0ABT0XCT1_9ACTN|nr:hypothetical protein [Streptomyces meridianus]MCM2580321.1 hypothetical protein [Streptomyces meridianus]